MHWEPVNQRIDQTEQLTAEKKRIMQKVWKTEQEDFWWLLLHKHKAQPLCNQGHPEQYAQAHIQAAFGDLQGGGTTASLANCGNGL